jgi:hypothetical protein
MTLRIGTAEAGGTFHGQGLALKTVLERDAALAPVEVLVTPGASVGNADLLERGAIDMGFIAANWAARATCGEPPFARAILLRTIAPMNAGPLFFIVRADTPLATTADLAGKRVVFGAAGSGMAQHARVIFAALGIANVVPVDLDFAAGGDALAAGIVDAQLQCPVPNAVMTALSQHVAVRVLPHPQGALERVLAAVPFYRRAIMERGAVLGLDHDVPQVGVLNLLVAHARLDGRIAAAATNAIAANAALLAQLNPLFRGLDRLIGERREGST